MSRSPHIRLTRKDYQQAAPSLAQKLLGCRLVHCVDGEVLSGRIVEAEAYTDDLASHAAAGKRTPRNRIMYGPPGVAYVYFTYGMHHCFNVVSEDEGTPGAVLVRGLDGIDHANGPARLCRVLRLSLADNGRDLCRDANLWIEPGRPRPEERIMQTTRIGISRATDLPYRFYLHGSSGVSKTQARKV